MRLQLLCDAGNAETGSVTQFLSTKPKKSNHLVLVEIGILAGNEYQCLATEEPKLAVALHRGRHQVAVRVKIVGELIRGGWGITGYRGTKVLPIAKVLLILGVEKKNAVLRHRKVV